MSVVGWKIRTQNDNKLVEDTLPMAYESNPGVTPTVQVYRWDFSIHHICLEVKEGN